MRVILNLGHLGCAFKTGVYRVTEVTATGVAADSRAVSCGNLETFLTSKILIKNTALLKATQARSTIDFFQEPFSHNL